MTEAQLKPNFSLSVVSETFRDRETRIFQLVVCPHGPVNLYFMPMCTQQLWLIHSKISLGIEPKLGRVHQHLVLAFESGMPGHYRRYRPKLMNKPPGAANK